MSRNLRTCMEKLKLIAQIPNPNTRKTVLKSLCDECLYKALYEIAVNTVNNKVPLTVKQKRHLRRYKLKILQLTRKTNNKNRQKQLVVQSGGIIPYLIPAIAAILGSAIFRNG